MLLPLLSPYAITDENAAERVPFRRKNFIEENAFLSDPLDVCAQGMQLAIQMLIATVDVFNIVYPALPLRHQRRNHQRRSGPKIGCI